MDNLSKMIVQLWFDGVREVIETAHDFNTVDPDEALQELVKMIPERGSKWLTVGDVHFNTYNLRALRVK